MDGKIIWIGAGKTDKTDKSPAENSHKMGVSSKKGLK